MGGLEATIICAYLTEQVTFLRVLTCFLEQLHREMPIYMQNNG